MRCTCDKQKEYFSFKTIDGGVFLNNKNNRQSCSELFMGMLYVKVVFHSFLFLIVCTNIEYGRNTEALSGITVCNLQLR